MKLERIFTNDAIDKRLVSEIYEQLMWLLFKTNKKPNEKNRQQQKPTQYCNAITFDQKFKNNFKIGRRHLLPWYKKNNKHNQNSVFYEAIKEE